MNRQEIKDILKKHKQWLETNGKEGQKAVLNNLKLENLDLFIEADLQKAELKNSNFSGSNFSKANLIEANFQGSILIGADLSHARLNDASLVNTDLTKAKLNGAFGSDADFFGATLVETDFTNTKLDQADFRKASFEKSDLSRARFQRTSFNEAKFKNCKFYKTDLEEADMKEVQFDKVDFTEANLFEANLQESTLSETIFKEAYLRTANLMGCKISNCDFSKSNLESSQMFGSSFKDCNFTSAELNRANITKVNFTNSIFDQAKLSFVVVDDSTLESFSEEIREKFERTWDVRDEEGKPVANYAIIRTVELPREYRQIGIQILGQLGYILQERHKDKISKFNLEQDGLKVTMVVETKKEHSETVEKTIEDFGKVVSGSMQIESFADNEHQLKDLLNLLEHIALQQQQSNSTLQSKVDELLLISGRNPSDDWNQFFSQNFRLTITPAIEKGFLFIDEIKISLGPVEYEMVSAMAKRLIRDWKDVADRKPTDAGWLSVEDFTDAVTCWTKAKSKTSTDITKILSRLESKVREQAHWKLLGQNLFENGKAFGFKGHYRITVHPSFITLEE